MLLWRPSMARDGSRKETVPQEVAAALERVRGPGKRVLVVFDAAWCRDSAALARLFEHPLVTPLVAAGFEVVRLDVGNRDRHLDLAARWGLDYAAGIPAVAALDPGGSLVGATTAGELASARTLSPVGLVALLHRWLPDAVRGTNG